MTIENRDIKTDIISIWKDLPYLGDLRDTSNLNMFSKYTMYEQHIRLMAQMRVILMSETRYGELKPYLESIKDNDDKIYELVKDATHEYVTYIKPYVAKDRLENYTSAIRHFMSKDLCNDEVETKVYNIKNHDER